MSSGFAIVVDVGKTMSKVSLWSREGRMLDKVTRRNAPVAAFGPTRLDTAGVADWVIETLSRFAGHAVEYIVPVAHGAAVAGLRNGERAFAPLDYEWEQPAANLATYRAVRAPFAQTGSPALPAGLNLGAQLHWQAEHGELEDVTLLPYAQYWAWLLSGVAASEVTSLGCHSDLWNPAAGTFSSLAESRGWAAQFAPLAKAGDVVGTLKPELATALGLPLSTKVLAGLHDSNAALLAARGFAEIANHEATVLSTGTWFVAMRSPQYPVALASLPQERDCLVNVDAYGQPVPSSRFMGGREIETLIELDTRQVDIKPDQAELLAAVPEVLSSGAMVLPTLAAGTGPFPHGAGGWVNRPEDWFARRAAACLYAALIADASLDLIGSSGRLLVEGRFAEAEVFVRALATLRPEAVVYTANAHNDVSFGALRLIDPALRPTGELRRVERLDHDLSAYRAAWFDAVDEAA